MPIAFTLAKTSSPFTLPFLLWPSFSYEYIHTYQYKCLIIIHALKSKGTLEILYSIYFSENQLNDIEIILEISDTTTYTTIFKKIKE